MAGEPVPRAMDLEMQEERLEQLAHDVERFAAMVGAPAHPALIRRTIAIFAVGFGSCPIEFRTTTLKPGASGREASFRYIDSEGSHDPYQLALAAGLVPRGGSPVAELIPQLRATIPLFGFGVDASAAHGLEKLWPFFDRPRPLASIAAIEALPEGVRRAAPMLIDHGCTHVATVAVDFRSATTNLYFPSHADAGAEAMAALLRALGCVVPSTEALAYFGRAGIVGITFSWARERVERVCHYVIAEGPEQLWLADDAILRAAAHEAPRRGAARYVVGGTSGPQGGYVKLELDYTGTSVALMARWLARLARKREANGEAS